MERYWNRPTFCLALVLIALAVIARKPDLVTNPQFMGDECTWFAEAWFTGPWHAIVHPQAGYLCIASKIPLLLAVHVPLTLAPAVFDGYTIAVQVLLAGFLLSGRLAHLANIRARAVLCFLCIALPNSAEVETLNNTQWMLGVLALLILFAEPPKALAAKMLDVIAIALISLTGPFCLLLLPIACLYWWVGRKPWTAVLACTLGAGCGVQLLTLVHALPPCRPMEVLNPVGVRILAGQVFLFGVFNGGAILPHASVESPAALDIASVVMFAGLVLAGYALWKGPKELKLFVLFAGLICASVVRRLHCDTGWNWQSLMGVSFAVRYWYIPRLAVLAILVWLIARTQPSWIRMTGACVLIALTLFTVTHWQYPAAPDFHWPYYARLVERSARGTTVWIPVNPPGWKFFLVAR
jgi:hypothetical protein